MLDPYLIMLSVKQGGIKYHFLNVWYDSIWDWTAVSRTIGEHLKYFYLIQIIFKQIYLTNRRDSKSFKNSESELTWKYWPWTGDLQFSDPQNWSLTTKRSLGSCSGPLRWGYCYMDAPHRSWLNIWRKSLTAITQEFCELYWTSPRSNTPQNSNCTKTMQVRRVRWTRHAGHCWRIKDELKRDVLQWTPSHGRAKVGRLARTDIQHLCVDTGCSQEDLLGAMDDRDRWWERVKEICASNTTWWGSHTHTHTHIYIYIYAYIHA